MTGILRPKSSGDGPRPRVHRDRSHRTAHGALPPSLGKDRSLQVKLMPKPVPGLRWRNRFRGGGLSSPSRGRNEPSGAPATAWFAASMSFNTMQRSKGRDPRSGETSRKMPGPQRVTEPLPESGPESPPAGPARANTAARSRAVSRAARTSGSARNCPRSSSNFDQPADSAAALQHGIEAPLLPPEEAHANPCPTHVHRQDNAPHVTPSWPHGTSLKAYRTGATGS